MLIKVNLSLSYGITVSKQPTERQKRMIALINEKIAEYSKFLTLVSKIERQRDAPLKESRLRRAKQQAHLIKKELKDIGMTDTGIRNHVQKYRREVPFSMRAEDIF